MAIYYINRFAFPPIKLDIPETPPPCFSCGLPMNGASMSGPLVCGSCDCGRNRDGTQKTDEDLRRSSEHFGKMIEKYEVKA